MECSSNVKKKQPGIKMTPINVAKSKDEDILDISPYFLKDFEETLYIKHGKTLP